MSGAPEIYDYVDEAGRLLYQVLRGDPKRFLQRRPDPGRPGAWIWHLGGVRRVPYRLRDLQGQERVLVFEGERHANLAHALGFRATTTAGGAHGFQGQAEAVVRAVRAAHVDDVILFADHDGPGYAYMRDWGTAWLAVGGGVRVATLPGLPPRGDILDWAGTVPEAERAARLAVIVEAAVRCETRAALQACLTWPGDPPEPTGREHSESRARWARRPGATSDLWPLVRARLEARGPVTGPDGSGNYRVQCVAPEHPDRHPSMDVHPVRGFICRACGAHGGIVTIARTLGIRLRSPRRGWRRVVPVA
jgi:hypothetical protein